MERLRMIDPADWPPSMKDAIHPEERTALENGLMRFFAVRPDLAAGVMAMGGSLKRNRQLPERMMELMRLRIAFHNQCRSCMAIRYKDAMNDGLTEELVCSLEKPYEAPGLTDAEKAAIRFGELLASNHLAIDDDVYAELHRHFTDGEIVEIGLYAAFCVGLGRWAATLHMVEELPDAYQQVPVGYGAVTPWGTSPSPSVEPSVSAEWLAAYAADDCIDVTCRGRRSGRPHTIEIWFGIDAGSMYLISGNGPTADWYRNMLAEPSVTVRFADGLERVGTARDVTDPDERRRVGDLMGAKYRWNGDPSIGLTRQASCYEVPVIAIELAAE